MAETTPASSTAKVTKSGKARRIVIRLLRSLLLVYVVVCIVLYALQTSLIFPGASMQGSAEARIRARWDEELVQLKTPDAVAIAGLFGKADPVRGEAIVPAGVPRGTVLFFYGNAMCVSDATTITDHFRALGYQTMLVDFEGFGMSGGTPSEQGCYRAAEAAYQYLLTRGDVDSGKIVVSGWSLGAAVAIDLAYRHREEKHICALMTFSAFSSMVDLAGHLYPYLPVSLVLKHRFMSIEKVGALEIPFFAAHGVHDSLIPFGFSKRLVDGYGKGAIVTFVPWDSDHNDIFDCDTDGLMRQVGAFLKHISDPRVDSRP